MENFIVSNTTEQNMVEESKDFPPPDNTEYELKSTTPVPDLSDDFHHLDTINEEKQEQRVVPKIAPIQEEVINEQNKNIEHEAKVEEVTDISSLKVLKIKGARSTQFSETDSDSLEDNVASEKNVKDDVVAGLNEAEHDTKKTAAADDNTVSEEAVRYPEEGERLHRIPTGGVRGADSQVMTVIASLLCVVVMSRL